MFDYMIYCLKMNKDNKEERAGGEEGGRQEARKGWRKDKRKVV